MYRSIVVDDDDDDEEEDKTHPKIFLSIDRCHFEKGAEGILCMNMFDSFDITKWRKPFSMPRGTKSVERSLSSFNQPPREREKQRRLLVLASRDDNPSSPQIYHLVFPHSLVNSLHILHQTTLDRTTTMIHHTTSRPTHFLILLFVTVFQSVWISSHAFTPTTTTTSEGILTQYRRNLSPMITHGLTINDPFLSTALHATKKKSGGGGSGGGGSAVSHGGKVQVKLLKHVAGVGQAGEVVLVTPAFFNNKLRPSQSAKVISDDEVTKQQNDEIQKEKESMDMAKILQEKINDSTIHIMKKAGPDGHLFGGINIKMIVSELQESLGTEYKDYMGQKNVKVLELSMQGDGNQQKVSGDIKNTGSFVAKISLRKEISAKFNIVVEAEH